MYILGKYSFLINCSLGVFLYKKDQPFWIGLFDLLCSKNYIMPPMPGFMGI